MCLSLHFNRVALESVMQYSNHNWNFICENRKASQVKFPFIFATFWNQFDKAIGLWTSIMNEWSLFNDKVRSICITRSEASTCSLYLLMKLSWPMSWTTRKSKAWNWIWITRLVVQLLIQIQFPDWNPDH